MFGAMCVCVCLCVWEVRGCVCVCGEFLWSLRMDFRVTMLCVSTPLVTFQTISRNDNLTLKFSFRTNIRANDHWSDIVRQSLVCCFILEVNLSANSVTSTPSFCSNLSCFVKKDGIVRHPT